MMVEVFRDINRKDLEQDVKKKIFRLVNLLELRLVEGLSESIKVSLSSMSFFIIDDHLHLLYCWYHGVFYVGGKSCKGHVKRIYWKS